MFGTIAARFNDDGVTAVYQHLRSALDLPRGSLARVDTDVSTGSTVIVPPARERYLADVAETVRGYHAADRRAGCARPAPPAPADREGRARGRRRGAPSGSRSAARRVARRRSMRSPARCVRRSRGRRCREWRYPASTTTASCCGSSGDENLPGRYPFTAGVFPLKREGEDPARMFAGEGGPARTNRRFHLLARGPAGDPSVDRVRLGDVVRVRSRRAARHLREGRELGRVDRDARRHEGAVRRVRPRGSDDVGVDDDQRSGADDPRDVPQRRDRPASRARPERGAALASAAPCRPTSSRRTRARTPASSRPSSRCGAWPTCRNGSSPTRCGTSTASRSPATTWPRPARTRSRNSRSRSRTGSRTSRRTSPAGWMSTTSPQPQLLLLERHGSRVHGPRPRRSSHLGDHHARPLRRQRTEPEAQVPRPDVGAVAARAGDGVQRHQDHAAGDVRDLRQRQLAPHERVRRGGDHADVRVGAARARHPTHHQPRVGPRHEREPPAG